MAKVLQFRRDTTSGLSTVTGAEGELFVDLTKDTLVVMDGTTQGGQPLQKELDSNTDLTVRELASSDAVFSGIVTASSVSSPFFMSYNQITSNFTVPSNYNAMSVGPTLTVGAGVTVTVSSNANWSIVPEA